MKKVVLLCEDRQNRHPHWQPSRKGQFSWSVQPVSSQRMLKDRMGYEQTHLFRLELVEWRQDKNHLVMSARRQKRHPERERLSRSSTSYGYAISAQKEGFRDIHLPIVGALAIKYFLKFIFDSRSYFSRIHGPSEQFHGLLLECWKEWWCRLYHRKSLNSQAWTWIRLSI